MSDAINSIKIGKPLENLVDEAIRDLQLRLDVLHIPSFLRESVWGALTRRALAKALECKR